MPRHSKEESRSLSSIDALRQSTIEKFFGLTDKIMKHILWSVEAQVPCGSCSRDAATGAHIPGRAKDADGNCSFCHGSYMVPDKNQRNWATEKIAERIAPPPKTVEMNVDQQTTVEEDKAKLSKLSNFQIEELQRILDGEK